MSELRTHADVASWLAGGMLLRRVDGDVDDALVSAAIAACASELPALPPPAVIADVAVMLAGGRPVTTPPVGDDALRAAIRAYEDDVLARLAHGARFDDVVAAYAHAAPNDRPAAIALVVGAICERAAFDGAQVSPGALRRALSRPRDERDQLARDTGAPGELADAYLRLARGARQCRALVDDREVFAVDHLAVLRDLGGRMTADHVLAAAEAIGRTLPRRLTPHRAQRGTQDTQFADDTLYPAGGFSAITPGGSNTSIENLVTSELVYMEDGNEPDIFTLRYVEGELLFYTRDDSVFRRRRHVVTVALAADLDDARVKDRGLPWQRLVLALGWLVAAVRWLGDQLGDRALQVHLMFPPKALVEERQIVTLLLEGEIARGAVAIGDGVVGDAIAAASAAGATALADLVVVSLGAAPDAAALPKALRALHVDLARPAPALRELSPRRGDAPELGVDAWTDWCDGAEDLLRWLV
jgi:hypothetical protein|nr:hypothetical protein [Kofleriaceae bacterium]